MDDECWNEGCHPFCGLRYVAIRGVAGSILIAAKRLRVRHGLIIRKFVVGRAVNTYQQPGFRYIDAPEICCTLQKTSSIDCHGPDAGGVLEVWLAQASVVGSSGHGDVAMGFIHQVAEKQARIGCQHLGIAQIKIQFFSRSQAGRQKRIVPLVFEVKAMGESQSFARDLPDPHGVVADQHVAVAPF